MSTEPVTVADLGEFGLIGRIRSRLTSPAGLLIGPGDDAALLDGSGPVLAAADMLVEGVHFDFAFGSPADAGYKALAVNVSDIGAMGGRARFALVSLAAPAATPLATLDALYDGMLDACERFGVSIAGGDTTSGPCLVVAVTVLGEPGPVLATRSGAAAGDLVCVTGSVGAAAAGLALARVAGENAAARRLLDEHPGLLGAYRRPRIRPGEAAAAAAAGATAMLDVSDGLARDATHLAEESGLGMILRIADVRVADGVGPAAELLGTDPLRLAIAGGDDYELALTVPPGALAAVTEAIAPLPLTVVGEMTDDPGRRVVLGGGGEIDAATLGWEHFA